MGRKRIGVCFSGKPYKLDESRIRYSLQYTDSSPNRNLKVQNIFFDDVVWSEDVLPESLQDVLSECIDSFTKDIKSRICHDFEFELDFVFRFPEEDFEEG